MLHKVVSWCFLSCHWSENGKSKSNRDLL